MKRGFIRIYYGDVYGDPIIGYDKEFWRYCVEPDRVRISKYRWSYKSKKYEVRMMCPRGHSYNITPYEFKHKRKCPLCIEEGEKGGINIDSSITIYYDDIYIIEEISENSSVLLGWKCPLCNHRFKKLMIEMLNVFPRCDLCLDGQTKERSDVPNDVTFIK